MTDVTLMGKGDLAVQAAQWLHDSPDHDLTFIVPVVPEPGWTGSLIGWAGEHGVPCAASGDWREIPALAGGDDLGLVLSVFYDRIVPAELIDRCARIINLHNGPLPRYRGVAPVNWALRNGERTHGVTIHEITPGIDDGPVLAQVEFTIDPEHDEVQDVYRRCLRFGRVLLEETLPRLERITPRAQDETAATYYSAADAANLGDRRDFTRARSLEGAAP